MVTVGVDFAYERAPRDQGARREDRRFRPGRPRWRQPRRPRGLRHEGRRAALPQGRYPEDGDEFNLSRIR
jgi:hypothetical protein